MSAALGLWAALGGLLAAQEPPSMPEARHPWNELDTSWISVRLDLQAFVDGAFYAQNALSKQQVGDLTPEGLFRVDDLTLSGQIKFPRPWSYMVGGSYRGLDPTDTRNWTTSYVYVSVPLPVLGSVTIGKQKQGVGLEMMENGRDTPLMERSTMTTAFAFVNSHIVGIRFADSVARGRMTWSAGWFNNWLDDGLSFDESGQIYSGRVTGLPIEANGDRTLLHLGVSAAYRQASNGSFKLKSVPEVYEAPDFVDTGSFPARSGTTIAGELAAVEGPVTISAEYASTNISSSQVRNPGFSGFYVMASWVLTGEARPYNHADGTFGRILPAKPFSFRHGGLGAWELAARYSSIDLTSGTIDGGKFERWSGALSWYPAGPWRFEFDYGYGRLQRGGLDGRTNFYQLRLQFQL